MQDTPSIFTASITATWLLLAAPHLNPANMLTVAQLLVGPSCTAGAVRCLRDYPKGRAVLRRVGRQWQIMHELLQEAEERKLQARIGGVLPPPRPLPPQDIKGEAPDGQHLLLLWLVIDALHPHVRKSSVLARCRRRCFWPSARLDPHLRSATCLKVHLDARCSNTT